MKDDEAVSNQNMTDSISGKVNGPQIPRLQPEVPCNVCFRLSCSLWTTAVGSECGISQFGRALHGSLGQLKGEVEEILWRVMLLVGIVGDAVNLAKRMQVANVRSM